MAHLLIVPVATRKILVQIFGPIAMFALVSLTIFHFCSLSNKRTSSKTSRNKSASDSISIKLSYGLVINAIFTEITLIMLLFTNLVSQNYCDVLLHTGPPSWTTYKLIMYLILTRRAQESFDKSAFAYSSVKIRIWMILLITWSTLNIICNVFTSTFYISSNPHEIPQCDVELDPPLLISMILLDLVGGFGSAYLMINPLLQINRMRKQTGQQISIKFQNIAHKQAILSGISIITSWFAMVMIILTDNMHLVWVSLDLVISTLTVILIYDWNKWLFEKMCCCIVKDKREMNNDNIDLESVAASDGNEPQKDFIEYEQVEQTSSV